MQRQSYLYMPEIGKLPGKSFEQQTEIFFHSLLDLVKNTEDQSGNASQIAQQALESATSAIEVANRAITQSGEAYREATQEMRGASAYEDGVSGRVPQPLMGQQNLFLRGDAQWAEPEGTEYQAGAGLVLNGETFSLAPSGTVSGDYGPRVDEHPVHGASFDVPFVSVDAYGRVTQARTSRITLPLDANTDTLVVQSLSDSSANFPILLTPTAGASTSQGAKETIFASSVTVNPYQGQISAERIVANEIIGTIEGNAATASRLANAVKIGISGGATGTPTDFDGSENITIPITALDMSKATAGILPVSRGGTGQSSVANIMAGKDAAGNTITATYATKDELEAVRESVVQVVDTLPASGTPGIVYLVPNATNPSTYDQYTWQNGQWISLGNTSFDLTNYPTKSETISDLTISGRTITYTKADGTTGTLTTQDNNTTYSAGTGLKLTNTTFSLDESGVTAGSYGLSSDSSPAFGGTFRVPYFTVDAYGQLTAASHKTITVPSTVMGSASASAGGASGLVPASSAGDQAKVLSAAGTWVVNTGDTHWTTHLYAGASDGNTNAATTNGNTYLIVCDNTTARDRRLIQGSGATSVASDANGVITISSTNTTYSNATQSAAGLMSANDKKKLDGVQTAATAVAFSASLTSGTKVGTITINGTATDLYCQTNTNTDTLMTQNVASTDAAYPILMCPTANATANQGAKTGLFSSKARINGSTGEIITDSANGIRFRQSGASKYSSFIRNDGSSTYWLVTAANTPDGSWTTARPLTINNATGVCNINGNAATATSAGTCTGNAATATTASACSGNSATANRVQSNQGTGSYVNSIKLGAALASSSQDKFGAIWNAPTKNYRVACATYPTNDDKILWYSITNANVSSSTNTVAKSMSWDGGTGILTATGFSGPLTGNVTGNCSGSSGSCTGNAATATKATQDSDGKAINSTYLKLAGGTMTGNIVLTDKVIQPKVTGVTRGTSTTATYPFPLQIIDNAGKTLGGVYYEYLANKTAKTHLMCYQGTTNANTWSSIGVGYDNSGNTFTWAPTPATADNSTKIATTAFVKAQSYITASSNITGTSANVTGTVAIANGGTGATTRLNALKNLTNEGMTTSNAKYFLCINDSWANGGYLTVANAKTVLGVTTYNASSWANMFGANVAASIASNACSLNVANGATFTLTVNANVTFTFTGVPSGRAATFSLVLTNGGSKTVTWPSSVKWNGGSAPTLTASGTDIITFLTNNGGTTWYGVPSSIKAS